MQKYTIIENRQFVLKNDKGYYFLKLIDAGSEWTTDRSLAHRFNSYEEAESFNDNMDLYHYWQPSIVVSIRIVSHEEWSDE